MHPVPRFNQVILVVERRARADDAHLAGQNVVNLRQFVQAGFAQECAAFGDIAVGVFQQVGGHIVGRIPAHGAELEDIKVLFPPPYTALFEENRTGRITLDPDGNDPHGDGQHNDSHQRKDKVQQTFDIALIHVLILPSLPPAGIPVVQGSAWLLPLWKKARYCR